MRASLALLVALAFGGLASPVLAQSAPPDTPSAPAKPDKGDDALSPSTLPKARQNVKESGTVDALSPDETRRLERMRAKRAAAAKPPSAKPQAEPAPAAPAKAEIKEAVTPSRAPRSAASAAPPAPAPPQQAAQAPAPAATPPAKATPAKTASTKIVPTKIVPTKTASTKRATPAVVEKADRESRPVHHAGRRTHEPMRAAADVDMRRPSRRAYAPPPAGRPWPEVADRAPRVGDVVPPGVPLYPVPPGYGGRPYPPFPRGPGDDGYPPRRVFMEPY